MRILDLYKDYHINSSTEGKNVREGWVGVHCPFCVGSQDYHLGYHLDEDYFSCWRCGGHPTIQTIQNLLSVSYGKAEEIIKRYGGVSKKKVEARVRVGTNKFKFPNGDLDMLPPHKKYLERRKFDSKLITKDWRLKGAGPVARLDGINYSWRIIAPIMWNGRVVSFQGRDISNRHQMKYMACPQDRELVQHQHILYCDQTKLGKRAICVEGITDVWRLGPEAAFAVFGITYTPYQVQAISKLFEEVIILFYPEDQAQKQAKKLEYDLLGKNVKAWRVTRDTDPGDMSQDDANHLVKQLL